jgi:hypothetical protein
MRANGRSGCIAWGTNGSKMKENGGEVKRTTLNPEL